MKKILFTLLVLHLFFNCYPQIDPIVVAEQTVKVGGKKELYYGFAEGDEIVFDLDVVKGKHLKEVEITEYPSSSKFMDFKTKKVKDKRVKVNKTGIYKFRLKGGGIGTKVCRARISRIPASKEMIDFNTSVEWRVRCDSSYHTKYKKELTKVDTSFMVLADQVERVHSKTNLDSPNTTRFNVNLPANKYSKLQTSEVISWAYWIGVGNEGQQTFEKEKKKFLQKSISTVAAIDPMTGLALGAYTAFSNPPKGDNVRYWISKYYDGVEYTIKSGNSIVASGRDTDNGQGSLKFTLQNDNLMNGINVTVKVTAMVLTKTYINRPYEELQVESFKFPVLSSN